MTSPNETDRNETAGNETEPAAVPLRVQRLSKTFVEVLGTTMAFHESGTGDPIVFLHGNPTSSYLWRNVIPQLSTRWRCIAPDLIGQGDSAPVDCDYRFVDHRWYLDALLDSLDLGDRITLVVHDWGSALGFDWANRHRDRVRAIAYMEAIVRPMTWDEFPAGGRDLFRSFRTAAGEQLILERNMFIEAVLPGSILRRLDDAEMAEYRRPFLEPGVSRLPTLSWPRELPFDGEPADVAAIVAGYAEWLSRSDVAKLFVNADPGQILTGSHREFCRTWPNQTEVTVPGLHFLQEDSPHEIGRAISAWLTGITQ